MCVLNKYFFLQNDHFYGKVPAGPVSLLCFDIFEPKFEESELKFDLFMKITLKGCNVIQGVLLQIVKI